VQEESLIEEADAIAEFAEAIGRGGQRLQRTLTSVLDLSHIESDTLEVRPQSFDADALVAETIDFFRPQATERGLRIYPVLPERPVPVETDQSALTRILDNLISNAVKFTPEGHVTVGLVAAEDEIIVWVLDTGIGMSQAFMERLFEPFVQESAGIDRDFEGVGIGMTITRRLTELLGGTIAVSSKQDEGSLFTVTVPRRYAGG
jgi:signal transduction histidine kinase